MGKEIILIIDPETHTQWTLKTFLESEGYEVLAASSIEAARKTISRFGLSGLITEYWVNRSSTIGIIRKFKKLFPEAYVMMLANGEVQEKEYQKVLDAGVDDYFLKPFPSQKILLHLRKGLSHHQNSLTNKGFSEEICRNFMRNAVPGQ
jgi:DNA-binding response OmpR family regulator